MVIDDTADIVEAARNTRISKTNDHGSGCSADGNVLVDAAIYDAFLQQLQAEGGYLVSGAEKARSKPRIGTPTDTGLPRRLPVRRRSWPSAPVLRSPTTRHS